MPSWELPSKISQRSLISFLFFVSFSIYEGTKFNFYRIIINYSLFIRSSFISISSIILLNTFTKCLDTYKSLVLLENFSEVDVVIKLNDANYFIYYLFIKLSYYLVKLMIFFFFYVESFLLSS